MKVFVAILGSLVCHIILFTQTRGGNSAIQKETQNWLEPLEFSGKVRVQQMKSTVGSSEKKLSKNDNNSDQEAASDERTISYQRVLSREELLRSGNHLPKYPEIAVEKGWQGIVKLKLVVSVDGRVIESSVIESSGFSILDEAALKASHQWTLNLAPGISMVVAPVQFILDS
ncbi:MAG: energy transducer TonB [Deltaproteobacteria bacterium]|nr:energy transducer TonB [Deltaproteobacteria bacterium]